MYFLIIIHLLVYINNNNVLCGGAVYSGLGCKKLSKEDFDYRMGKKVANYAQIKNEAILAWEAARYEGSLEDADSEVYLAFMTAFINERGL